MFGMWEYFNYAGYGNGTSDGSFFSQYADTHIGSNGFSFADYMAEIDEGRLVMIHVDEHSMLGCGYDGPITQYISTIHGTLARTP